MNLKASKRGFKKESINTIDYGHCCIISCHGFHCCIWFEQKSSDCVMDCHATAWGSIPGGDGVKTELHVLRKGQ